MGGSNIGEYALTGGCDTHNCNWAACQLYPQLGRYKLYLATDICPACAYLNCDSTISKLPTRDPDCENSCNFRYLPDEASDGATKFCGHCSEEYPDSCWEISFSSSPTNQRTHHHNTHTHTQKSL